MRPRAPGPAASRSSWAAQASWPRRAQLAAAAGAEDDPLDAAGFAGVDEDEEPSDEPVDPDDDAPFDEVDGDEDVLDDEDEDEDEDVLFPDERESLR